ncbi:universal stress protein [Natronorarus salvus]|uniref:universal stress protein n=1 Tax=Natronorarus salvus TaxID=3117733 RepID=UPI002F26BE72
MTHVLVPIEVLEGETVSAGLMELLGTVNVTVLGYHVLPEQTPPDQARMQFEERATSALEDLAEGFRAAGGEAYTRLVFTHDEEKTIDRVAEETSSHALAISGAAGEIDSLLVALSGDVAVDHVLGFVEELIGGRDVEVTLLLATREATDAEERLERAADRLAGAGIAVRRELSTDRSPFDALLEAVPGHDAIVMGEQAPSLASLVFGDEPERVASASVGPVLVVRTDPAVDG